ncbi:MAG: ribulose-phosphate 3-epimerase [bacterium]|nr:ribulose-phosphate 3-epimerase [bacterium]
MEITVLPAILEQDINELQRKVDMVKGHVSEIHLDVMDNQFVPNETINDPEVISEVDWGDIQISLHLMINNPLLYLKKWALPNVSSIFVHREAVSNLEECIKTIRELDKKVGIAINPHTSTYDIKDVLDDLDAVMVMAVEPGFSAQAFNADVLEKIAYIRELKPDMPIYVDGGVSDKSKDEIIMAGASVLCANSYIFKSDDIAEAIKDLGELTQQY